jgi:hypothetical protein
MSTRDRRNLGTKSAPHRGLDGAHDFLKLGDRVLVHLPLRRRIKVEEGTENDRVGAHAIVRPLGASGLTRGLPLRKKIRKKRVEKGGRSRTLICFLMPNTHALLNFSAALVISSGLFSFGFKAATSPSNHRAYSAMERASDALIATSSPSRSVSMRSLASEWSGAFLDFLEREPPAAPSDLRFVAVVAGMREEQRKLSVTVTLKYHRAPHVGGDLRDLQPIQLRFNSDTT